MPSLQDFHQALKSLQALIPPRTMAGFPAFSADS
jgi:hypothetical protein